MFGSTPASGHDNSGVSGQQQLIPTRFVWPYGGSSVFISGSFTRWTEHLPMSPTEGLPTVFQIICSVTPGYHQYKFFVDGQWRHDELQAFVNGNYGVVNTVFVARQPMFPATLTVETPGRTNMDVDDAFPRGTEQSDCWEFTQGVPKILEPKFIIIKDGKTFASTKRKRK